MTRVLVVHHDVDVADIQVEELRRAGYEVEQCAGPIGGSPCPVMCGDSCWQVDRADVLVYDVWASGDGRAALIEDLRELYPEKPVVLTSGGLMLDWVQSEGPHQVTPVLGPPNRTLLAAAVEAALRTTPSRSTDESGAGSGEKGEPLTAGPGDGPARRQAGAAGGRHRAGQPVTPRMPRW
jgi:DNA-binding NtrC family response regulator